MIGRAARLRCGGILVSCERPLLADKSVAPPRLISLPGGRLIWFASIAMIASGAPVAIAVLGRPSACGMFAGFFRGCPQSAAREPFHLGVRMFLVNALERRQQIVAVGSAEGRG
jgi:hypothetical protein